MSAQEAKQHENDESISDPWNVAGGVQPVVGGIYKVHHSRKGVFQIRVTYFDGVWMTGTIVGNDKAGAMMEYNEKYPGDSITIRNCHTRLTPLSFPPTTTTP